MAALRTNSKDSIDDNNDRYEPMFWLQIYRDCQENGIETFISEELVMLHQMFHTLSKMIDHFPKIQEDQYTYSFNKRYFHSSKRIIQNRSLSFKGKDHVKAMKRFNTKF